MNRKDFIRNTIMGLAASMLPRILQPTIPEVLEEKYVFDGIIPTIESRKPYILYHNEEFLFEWKKSYTRHNQ